VNERNWKINIMNRCANKNLTLNLFYFSTLRYSEHSWKRFIPLLNVDVIVYIADICSKERERRKMNINRSVFCLSISPVFFLWELFLCITTLNISTCYPRIGSWLLGFLVSPSEIYLSSFLLSIVLGMTESRESSDFKYSEYPYR